MFEDEFCIETGKGRSLRALAHKMRNVFKKNLLNKSKNITKKHKKASDQGWL
jgi:hypothetical protein